VGNVKVGAKEGQQCLLEQTVDELFLRDGREGMTVHGKEKYETAV
jgi:hypothetical protein